MGRDLLLAWRALRGRSGRIVLILVCLALGVVARVTVGSALHDARGAVDREARSMIGADLIFSADEALSDERRADLADMLPAGSRHLDRRGLVSMAADPDGGARLVKVQAVPEGWPLRGSVRVSEDEGRGLAALFAGPNILVQRDLLVQLDLAVGDSLRLGQSSFRIAGVIEDLPGVSGVALTMGPIVLIDNARLDATGLTGFAARTTHVHEVMLPIAADPDALAAQIRARWDLPEDRAGGFMREVRAEKAVDLTTPRESLAMVDRFLNRFGDFLRILSLLALLLGGIGVAHLIRGVVMASMSDSALLAVLGARPGRVVRIMTAQVLLLGLAAGVLGGLVGWGIHLGAVQALGAALPIAMDGRPHVPSFLWGCALALGTALVAGLPPVLGLRHLRPLAILRGDTPRLRADPWWGGGVLVLGLVAALLIAAWETRSWQLGPALVIGALVVGLLLAVCGRVLLPLIARLGRLRGRAGGNHGLRNLARPGFRPTAALVALGLAACTLGVLSIYRHSFQNNLTGALSGRAPAIYAIEIPPDQIERFREIASASGAAEVELAPMIVSRLRAINGVPIGSEPAGDDREAELRHRFRTREQRLSIRDGPGPDETVIAGAWHEPDSVGEASIAQVFAENAGVGLGDRLTFEIFGTPVEATVTSIRAVDWLGFRINFFVYLSRETLAGAPRTWIGTVDLPPGEASREARLAIQGRIAAEFPQVLTIDVYDQVAKGRRVFERMALAVGVLAFMALLTGIAVLVGIATASAHERRRDAALLRVLGADDATLRAAALWEFGIIGLLAALLGIALALLAAWGLIVGLLDLDLLLPWGELALLLIGLATACALTGVWATRRVRRAAPLTVLRAG